MAEGDACVILCVHNDENIRKMLELYLSSQLPEYQIVTVSTQAEARTILSERSICLIISQVKENTDKATGNEFTHEISENPLTASIPILMLVSNEEIFYGCMNDTAVEYPNEITEPFDVEELLLRIKAVISLA